MDIVGDNPWPFFGIHRRRVILWMVDPPRVRWLRTSCAHVVSNPAGLVWKRRLNIQFLPYISNLLPYNKVQFNGFFYLFY